MVGFWVPFPLSAQHKHATGDPLMSAGLLSPRLGNPDLLTFQVSVSFSIKWEQILAPS